MLGIPMAVHKTEVPVTALIFLGSLTLATLNSRLLEEKLARLQAQLQSWGNKKYCRRNELESLLVHLSHAATVVRYGRIFLRHLFGLLSCARSGHHIIHLNAGARADLLWWKVFLLQWNGRSFFPLTTPLWLSQQTHQAHCCGAISSDHGFFQLEWPASLSLVHISANELVIAAAMRGPSWHNSCTRFQSDNLAVVATTSTTYL